MKVQILVCLDVSLLDQDGGDLPDPAVGDPLRHRIRESAREAIETAVRRSEGAGFAHDMEGITSISVEGVRANGLCKAICG